MTLHPQTDCTIPEETIRVARAAYPHGNTLMKMRDALGTIYQDQSFASLFPHNGRAVEAPWRLALITVLQFMEELPDRQAADAVVVVLTGNICWDWSWLILALTPACYVNSASVWCKGVQNIFCWMPCWISVRSADGSKRGNASAPTRRMSWPRIRAINRHMCVGEAMRFALNSLAVVAR